jgi:hypothetical protein
MNIKLAVVLLFALVAASQQGYVTVNTWADENCNTTLVAKYITTDLGFCPPKRAVAQVIVCESFSAGSYVSVDYSNCFTEVEPAFPEGWQSVKLGGDQACNFTSYGWFGAPEALQNTPVAVLYPEISLPIPTNISLSCANTGVLSFSAVVADLSISLEYTLAAGACLADSGNATWATQTSCLAPPVAPVAEPTAAPVVAPVSAPVRAPVKAPSTKTSAAPSIINIFGSVAVIAVSIVALF